MWSNKKAVGARLYSLANSFNHSKNLKKPIFLSFVLLGVLGVVMLGVTSSWLIFLIIFIIAMVGYYCTRCSKLKRMYGKKKNSNNMIPNVIKVTIPKSAPTIIPINIFISRLFFILMYFNSPFTYLYCCLPLSSSKNIPSSQNMILQN